MYAGADPKSKGFNAMFAVSSVDAAKLYYESFKEHQKGSDKPLRIATIFFNYSRDVDNGGMSTSTFPIGLKSRPFARAIAAMR